MSFHKFDCRETTLSNAANHLKIFLIEFEICLYKHLYFLYIRNPQFPIVVFISMLWQLNPMEPNPSVATRVVFPQSVRSGPEKRPFFHIFPHFSKIEPFKKYLPHIGVQYIKLKRLKCSFKCKRIYIVMIYRHT